MKKIIAVALSLTLGIISMALTPNFTFAHRADTGQELAAVYVPINQSRHVEFSVSPQGAVTAAKGADYYTLDATNSGPSTMVPDSGGYLDGVCSGVIKRYASGAMIWQLSLITRFQYDNFQSLRRVSLSSTARGYGAWSAASQFFNWGRGGNSWQDSYVDAFYVNGVDVQQGSIDEEVDSEGTCTVSHN